MAAPSEADLAQAKAAVGTLLEGMGLSAHLYAVEPHEGKWAVIVECATGSGWQRVELRAGPELLDAIRGDAKITGTAVPVTGLNGRAIASAGPVRHDGS